MDPDSRMPWIIAILLLLAAAFFALAETAFSSVSRSKIRLQAERGDSRAVRALKILDHFDRAISTLLICTNIVHIAAASVVTMAVTRKWGLSAVTLSTLLSTVVIFFAGEMLPKSIAKKQSYKCALSCAGPVWMFMVIFAPLAKLLTFIGEAVARLTKGDVTVSVTEDELYDIIDDMAEEGSLNEEQEDLISSALQFGDVTVESVLTPRVDITAIDIEDAPEEVLDFVKKQNHSRLPVYEGTVDHIIGVLQIRKFLKENLHSDGKILEVRSLMDPVYYAHQSMEVAELLPLMSKNKLNMAVVLDNYGGTLGIVTVEDILEELVGEIWDEDDVVEEPMTTLPDGSFLFDAEETVRDAFDAIEFEEPDEEERFTNLLLGEWAYEQFTEIPSEGMNYTYFGLSFTIAEMQGNRILKIRVERLPEEEAKESEEKGGEGK